MWTIEYPGGPIQGFPQNSYTMTAPLPLGEVDIDKDPLYLIGPDGTRYRLGVQYRVRPGDSGYPASAENPQGEENEGRDSV